MTPEKFIAENIVTEERDALKNKNAKDNDRREYFNRPEAYDKGYRRNER